MPQYACSATETMEVVATSSLKSRVTYEEIDAAISNSTLSDYGGLAMQDLRNASKKASWQVAIDREHGKLGVRVASTLEGTALVVVHIVVNGPVFAWNKEHSAEHIHCGDIISEVNGVRGNASAMHEALLQSGSTVQMHLTRYVEFPARIDAALSHAGTLGLEVNGHFIIEGVDADSGAATYMSLVPPELQVRPADRIVAVNGYRDKATMRRMLEICENVELLLQRPVPGSSPWTLRSEDAEPTIKAPWTRLLPQFMKLSA
mmetsp:Transcript_74445/g.177335  ORF Transcript_74445/g.177335 Transcript_74445/m.177335 type:complete len:261 (+) Transcript_74445:78-860(+)